MSLAEATQDGTSVATDAIVLHDANISVDGREIVRGASFAVGDGERLAILGSSGCGKTTIARAIVEHILGLAQHQGVSSRFDAVSYCPQRDSLLPYLPVRKNLKILSRGIEVVVGDNEHIEPFGLSTVLDQSPETLSAGQYQRVALLAAAMSGTSFKLVDEPLTGVDYLRRWRVGTHWARFLEARRHTLLLISHDIDLVLLLCQRAVVLGGSPSRVLFELKFPALSELSYEAVHSSSMLSVRMELLRMLSEADGAS